jgi:hypothetical protein
VHVTATGSELFRLIFSGSVEEFKSTVIIVDEFDGFLSMDRLRTFHLGNLGEGAQSDDVTTYCVDIMDLICRFRFVIGFCAFVDETITRALSAKLRAIKENRGPEPRTVYTFNFGNIRGDGVEIIKEPIFHTRIGHSKEQTMADTLRLIKEVLAPAGAPKCVFVVHAYKDQIEEMALEIERDP